MLSQNEVLPASRKSRDFLSLVFFELAEQDKKLAKTFPKLQTKRPAKS